MSATAVAEAVAEAPVASAVGTGTPEVITKQVATEIPAEGQVTVTLWDVDNTRFPNYRKNPRESHLMELMELIAEQRQLTPCSGSWLENGKIGLWSGFCRYEAMMRLALKKLVKEYNEANGKKSSDEGYVPLGGHGFKSEAIRRQIWEAGGEWQQKYEAALKSYTIDFKTMPVEDDIDAALKGIAANTYDKPPLMDLCERINALIEKGAKAKKVAKELGMTEGAVSQCRKIFSTPEYLRTLAAGDLSSFGPKKPEELEVIRQQFQTAIGELEVRLSKEQGSPLAISFSHAREFAGLVQHKDEPLPPPAAFRLLKDLVCMDDNGKLATDRPTPEWKIFQAKMSDAKKFGKKEEVATPAAAPTGGTTNVAGVTVPQLSKEQEAQKAAFDAAAAAATGQPVPAVPAGTAPASQGVPVTPTVGQKPSLSAEDQAKMAEVNQANDTAGGAAGGAAVATPDADLSSVIGPTTDELLSEDGAGIVVEMPDGQKSDKPTDGRMASTTKDAPVGGKYKIQPPEKLETSANKFVDFASDEGSDPATALGYLLAAIQLFTAIGMQEQVDILNEQYVIFTEAVEEWQKGVMEVVKGAKTEAEYNAIVTARPKFVKPKLTA